MIKEYAVCDCCGRAVKDHYANKGWIVIDGDVEFSVTAGRKADGSANTAIFTKVVPRLDFCNLSCLIHFLRKAPNGVTNYEANELLEQYRKFGDAVEKIEV